MGLQNMSLPQKGEGGGGVGWVGWGGVGGGRGGIKTVYYNDCVHHWGELKAC
jgi:hypothetical protein